MRRRVFTILSVLSLLLSLGLVALMIRSVFTWDLFAWIHWNEPTGRRVEVLFTSDAGACGFSVGYGTQSRGELAEGTRAFPAGCYLLEMMKHPPRWDSLHFLCDWGLTRGMHSWAVGVPMWLPALLLATPPTWYARVVLRQRRRRQKGLCLRCGYDLRASPDRCPECGMSVLAKPATEARQPIG